MSDDYAAFAKRLIEERFPTLSFRKLPCGGIVYSRRGYKEPGVHILYSPLPQEGVSLALAGMAQVHQGLTELMKLAYLEVLVQFNGANFFYPYVFLKGLQAHFLINREDEAYQPDRLSSYNHHERDSEIPLSELMIGGAWEPDVVVTVDAIRKIRLRSKAHSSRIVEQFSGYREFFDYALDPALAGASWRKAAKP
jgi:hypothetical protein